jgi:hypothetical protein
MENNTAQSLYDLLITRDFSPEALDSAGKAVTDPAQAELFSFDWKTPNKNYGTVVVLLGADKDLQIYFGDNLGRTMEGNDKKDWYDFLSQVKQFATRNMLNFEVQNLNRLKYTMQGMAAIKEGLFEGYYGTRKVSYSDQPKKTRLMIRHNRDLGEGEARYRAIESLFVETADGERFRVPSRSLAHGRMLARHIAEGGTPYDAFGQHITQTVMEINTLSKFIRAARNRQLAADAADITETAVKHYSDLKAKAKRIISQRGYHEERNSFDPADVSDREVAVEEIRNMFVEQSLDQRIEEALPILANLARLAAPALIRSVPNIIPDGEEPMKEINEFEQWTDQVSEGTWAMPETSEQKKRLQDLMAQELPVGPDAINATEQLYDIFGDDQLFDELDELSITDPDADARPLIAQRAQELGIDLEFNPEVQEASRGRPPKNDEIDNRDDGLPRIGTIVRTPTGLKHYARPERGGSIPEPDPLEKLNKQLTSRLDREFDVRYKSAGSKGIQLDEESVKFEPVTPEGLPSEGEIHSGFRLDTRLLPGFRDNSTGDDYSDTFYYRDPISGGVFAVYAHSGAPRIRGTDGMPESRVREIVQSLSVDVAEDLDTDGVMMTRPSNMSSESTERSEINRLVELARI